MAIYLFNSTVGKFCNNRIEDFINQLENNFYKNYRKHTNIEQKNAWQSSLRYLQDCLKDEKLKDFQVILEYQLPFSGNRIDAVIIGNNKQNKPVALVIEFKGWKQARLNSEYEDQVDTEIGKQVHPDYQLANYIGKLKYSHSCGDDYEFLGALILYNLENEKCNLKFQNRVFYKNFKSSEFKSFILENINYPTDHENLNKFLDGQYTQNKKLFSAIRKHYDQIKDASHFVLAQDGFGLSNEQLNLIEEINSYVDKKEKVTFLIQGAPGSGKTLLAIHLLFNNLAKEKKTLLTYRNNRLINSLKKIFVIIEKDKRGSSYIDKKDKIKDLSGGIKFYSTGRPNNPGIAEKAFDEHFDIVIYDEAQRMTRENIGYAMQRADVQVFFFDENQILNAEEEGTFDNFREIAKSLSIKIEERFLNGYYRVIGGESYHKWVEDIITGQDNNLNLSWTDLYDFQIKDTFDEFINSLGEKVKENNNKVALVASFTESPGDTKEPTSTSIKNLRVGFPLYSKFDHYKNYDGKIYWLMDPIKDYVPFWVDRKCNNLEKCASIYGCQGFEADFIGLIWGRDFVIRDGKWQLGDNCEDNIGRRGLKDIMNAAKKGDIEKQKLALKLLQNRYRIFLTRGMKGTYIYFEDEETKKYFLEKFYGKSI